MRTLTRSEQADLTRKLRRQDAMMQAAVSPLGTVTVNCPYCLIYSKLENPVDVTRFVDGEGKREHRTSCSKGHTLHFKTLAEWREARQNAGLQVRG